MHLIMGHVHLVFTTALAFSLILVVWQQSSSAYTCAVNHCLSRHPPQQQCDMLSAASQEEEEALARALAERPDEDMDMANGDDDYPDEAEEVRCRAHGPQRWPPRMNEGTPQPSTPSPWTCHRPF